MMKDMRYFQLLKPLNEKEVINKMAFTYGFYNSLDGDRRYHALQMSSIFDGIILDGILFGIGDRFNATAAGAMTIHLGTGRAWFDHTWSYNDSIMALTVRPAEALLDRIDAIVLEVDRRDEARMNSIRWVYGTPSANPQRPELLDEEYIRQYVLHYVEVPRGVTTIYQANITSMIGTTQTPYVTAPLDKIDISDMVAQWNSQWSILLSSLENQKTTQQKDWLEQMNILHNQYQEMLVLYYAMETQTFNLINNNWDDWSVRRGCTRTTEYLSNGDVYQKIVIDATGSLLAEKTVNFNADNSILETVIFYPSEMVLGTSTVRTTSTTITKLTIFNSDGSIVETIGWVPSFSRLADSTDALLQDSDGKDLYTWE